MKPGLGAMALGLMMTVPVAQAQTGIGAAGSQPEKKTEAAARIGEPAPGFTLPDADGKEYRLEDYKGKIVVLQWINPDCPWCRGVHKKGEVVRMIEDLKKLDENVVHLAINSTYYMDAATSAKYLKDNKVTSPALIDQDGTVGHLYGAKTTPHMFVIDQKGILRYHGAFTDDQRGKKGEEATNFAINAVTQILAGDTVVPDYEKPWGCSVKYAKNKRDKAKERSRKDKQRKKDDDGS